MRVCITRSQKHAYTETFIRDQIEQFKVFTEVYPICGSRFPEKKENGKLLYPKALWVAHKMVKPIYGRNNPFSNYGMRLYLKKHKIDVVLSNFGTSASHMVAPCKHLNIPLIVIFHGNDASNRKLINNYKRKYKKLFEYASHIVAVSNEMKKDLIDQGASTKKISVIPCGVDTSKFIPSKSFMPKHFLSVGRFTAKKGPIHTIRAFYKVHKEFAEATLTMVGKKEGVLFMECQKLVKDLHLQNVITFPGILGHEQIVDIMNKSFAFVQHSMKATNGDKEGTPVSIIEASACALPIVSTEHGGIKDAVVHNSTGFLVSEKDETAMAKYMLELCANPSKAKEMGLNGRKHVQKHYEQKHQIKKLYQLAENSIRNS